MKYTNPPINEVSYGVRFEPLSRLSTAYYGRFWADLGSDFTEVFDQPPILDPPTAGAPVNIDPFARRIWIVHKAKNLLLQIQPDRFYMNWRKLDGDVKYPGFGVLQPLFQGYWRRWLDFLEKRELGTPQNVKGMLSYTDHVHVDSPWSAHDYFSPLSALSDVREHFPGLRGMGWSALFSHDGKRLVTEVKTFQRSQEGKRLLQLEVRVESEKVLGEKRAELEQWFCSAHDDVLQMFERVTTNRARAEWGRDVGDSG